MIELLCFILAVLASPFKSNTRLEAENAAPSAKLRLPPMIGGRDMWNQPAEHLASLLSVVDSQPGNVGQDTCPLHIFPLLLADPRSAPLITLNFYRTTRGEAIQAGDNYPAFLQI
jgi:hypothetical protein